MRKYFLLLIISCVVIGQVKETKWQTYFEKSNFLSTPSYQETIEYFKRLEQVSSFSKLTRIGVTPQGRDLYCFIVSKDKAFSPALAKKTGKPILLIQNGIHSGEIEGKDACMLLLREILVTKEKAKYINDVILMIIPVFNVDGHERKSQFNRINQNGPVETGWRTTAQNYNLNRDYIKADTPEMKAWLKLYSSWLPDMFIDSHTTDGADYQYTVTYGIEKSKNLPPATEQWVRNKFIPFVESETGKSGYKIAPYLTFKEDDWHKGISDWASTPRFSHGYTAVQNRPGLLIETHMLKPYKDRVFGTKAMMESVIKLLAEGKKEILKLNNDADDFVVKHYVKEKNAFPLSFSLTAQSSKMNFLGIESTLEDSWITGKKLIHYTGKPVQQEIPYFDQCIVKDSVFIPKGYLVPKEFKDLVDRMKLHGVKVDELKHEEKFFVERYKFKNVKFGSLPYEGHFLPQYEFDIQKDSVLVTAGTYLINTNQRTAGIIAHCLEPLGPDSFLKWGFFNTIFEQKEYFEDYAMEPVAQKMMNENPKLKEEFLKKLESDPKMKESARQRLNFFYERSPYYDHQLNVYPVLRVVN
jgi:murein tripeptide amidase MpaA